MPPLKSGLSLARPKFWWSWVSHQSGLSLEGLPLVLVCNSGFTESQPYLILILTIFEADSGHISKIKLSIRPADTLDDFTPFLRLFDQNLRLFGQIHAFFYAFLFLGISITGLQP